MTSPLLPPHWRDRLSPAQKAQVEALSQAYLGENPEGGQEGFEAWLALQGWALPGDEAVENLLETITAHLEGDQAAAAGIPPGSQRYTLIGNLGLGDMGRIELVREVTLQRKVAMKLIRQHSDPALLRRFLIEAQVTAQLDHPHIVPIYSLENTSAGLAYTMKRVQGRTFAELIETAADCYARGLDPDAANSLSQRLDYFLAVCEAMEYAHSSGVIHRELEPANLMVGHYHEVYVMNWGSSRLLPDAGIELQLPPQIDPSAELGSPLAGKVAYFSPEQLAGGWAGLDIRSDLYVLGLILYELLCLRQALSGATPLELLEHAAHAELGPLQTPDGKRLPSDLQAIVAKATARKPEQRYPDVAALAADLRRYQRGEAVSARRDNPLQAASRWLVRHQLAALTLVMGLVLLSAGIGVWSLASQARELARVRAREQALNGFLAAVYQQSRVMNRAFLLAESQLESLASVAVSHFTQAQPVSEPFYLHENFHPPGRIVASSQYHSRVSVEWPLSVKTWSKPDAEVAPYLARLSPLRHYMQRVLIESQTYQPLSPPARERLIASTGTPVTYATIVLRQGAGAWLPGGDFEAPTYDPVKRPFYLFGANQHARRWGNPYIDVSGAGLLLIGATGLFDHENRFLGTASLDLKFDTIIKTMLDLPKTLQRLRGGFLLDEQGRVAIRSSQKGKQFSATIHPNIQLPLYGRPEVVAAIKAGKSGHVVTAGPDPLLIAYYRLPALGWYYVVEASLEQALQAAGAEQAP